MKIGHLQQSRPAFYDRNPVTRSKTYQAVLGPHGQTTRWTYTVPSGKKALISTMLALAQRVTAAAPVGSAGGEIDVTAVDATSTQLSLVRMLRNAVGDTDRSNIGSSTPLVAGEVLTALTADAGTGGTIEHLLACWLTEFDA